MTAPAARLTAIAAAREALTPAAAAARTAALNARTADILNQWRNVDEITADLDTQITTRSNELSAAALVRTTADASLAAKNAGLVTLRAQVADQQATLAALGTTATAGDVAERDEVVALLTELGLPTP